MADWIKMRSSLLTNPKVVRMARALLADPEFMDWMCPGMPVTRDERVTKRHIPVVTRIVVGALLPTWSAVNDTATRDGIVRNAASRDIDESAGVPGFGAALLTVGWLVELPGDSGVQFVNFEEYNQPQKERSLTVKTGAQRQAEYRERKKKGDGDTGKSDAASDATRDGDSDVTSDVTGDGRREKSRGEKKNTPQPPKGAPKRFTDFWLAWPKNDRKQDKLKCEQLWAEKGLDTIADEIVADVQAKRGTEKWREGFIEAPAVYLRNKRWEDGNTEAGEPQQETFV